MFLSDDEEVMLHALSQARGLTSSDLFRTQLRDAFAKYAKDSGKTTEECLTVCRARMVRVPTGSPPARVTTREK
jgi:hypothetical protein